MYTTIAKLMIGFIQLETIALVVFKAPYTFMYMSLLCVIVLALIENVVNSDNSKFRNTTFCTLYKSLRDSLEWKILQQLTNKLSQGKTKFSKVFEGLDFGFNKGTKVLARERITVNVK